MQDLGNTAKRTSGTPDYDELKILSECQTKTCIACRCEITRKQGAPAMHSDWVRSFQLNRVLTPLEDVSEAKENPVRIIKPNAAGHSTTPPRTSDRENGPIS